MLFFKRILGKSAADEASDRRAGQRYPVTSRFPMKTVLNTVGRDEMGNLLKPKDGKGWDWAGVLINLSLNGARMQVAPTVQAQRGDVCQLKFDLEGYQLAVPARIAHITQRSDSFVYGISIAPDAGENSQAYRQLIELVALGAALKPAKPAQPDEESGYLVEQYDGEQNTRLDVWREFAGRGIVAFDFRMRSWHVRGLRGRANLEYLLEDDENTVRPAPAAQAAEIHRLFHWVVPNIGSTVPEDVREFMQKFAIASAAA